MTTNAFAARHILEKVLSILQEADEIGGPEGAAYLALMDAVAQEALARRDLYRANGEG